jgi:LmbE family N-acetylglucosaminyl deacetylase
MVAVAQRRRIGEGDGTGEAQWLAWPGLAALPACRVSELVPPGSRVVVLAPHPDDEVLAAGGLLTLLARAGREPLVVAASDGEASPLGSDQWPRKRLLRRRPQESRLALRKLGLPGGTLRLGLPDGELARQRATLVERLQDILCESDVLVTTWRLDGHPDHEATGAAAAKAAGRVGCRLLEAPVWAWHWAAPGDPRLPWAQACRLPLGPDVVACKTQAVQAFQSQLQPDLSTGRGPVLRGSTVQRAARPFEVFFEAPP